MTSESYRLSVEKSNFQKLLTSLEKSGTSLTMMLIMQSFRIHVSPGTLQENRPISTNSQWSYQSLTQAQATLSFAHGTLRQHRRLLLRSKLTCHMSSHKLVLLELPSMQTKYFNSSKALDEWSGGTSLDTRLTLWGLTNSERVYKASLMQAMQRSPTKPGIKSS